MSACDLEAVINACISVDCLHYTPPRGQPSAVPANNALCTGLRINKNADIPNLRINYYIQCNSSRIKMLMHVCAQNAGELLFCCYFQISRGNLT